ncbi:MAG: septum site-determining protein MinC [Candidatus Tectimicrobiota bacterium]
MSKPRVKLSGTDYGLLLRLEWDSPLPQLLVELEEYLQQSPKFFAGAQVLLEIGGRPVMQQDMEQLGVVLTRYGVTLQGVVPVMEGLERRSPPPSPATFIPSPADPQTLIHLEQRTVRSGEKVAADGHLIIMGDVNPGAEVIAGYNIFVWGSLRGSAYAGVPDREDAIIAALHFAPIQLRIAGHIARPPEVRGSAPGAPELARIDQNAIVVEAWERGRGGFHKRG